MINNRSKNLNLFITFSVAFIIIFSAFASAELSLGIDAHLSTFAANFRAVTDSDSAIGFDGFDLEVPSSPAEPYAKFYSTVETKQLAVDSWPSTANPRTIDLTFQDVPTTSGSLVLSWNLPGASYNVTLKDYGSDSSRTSLVESIDMNSRTTKSFVSTGNHYFSLVVSNVVSNNDGSGATGGSGGSGGASGGSDSVCDESKLCTDWSDCQNLEDSLKSGAVVFEDYSLFKADCAKSKLNDKSCGYQIRECNVVSACSNTTPSQSQFCQYVKNPSCKDKVKNCHDGKCEVLVDCGGPCGACASCNNGIKDKGEQGIDCGGTCAKQCKVVPIKDILASENNKIYVYIGILVILLGVLIAFVARLVKLVSKVKEDKLKWYKL